MSAAQRVWVDGWQMQCCGDRFAVGTTVTWHLRSPLEEDTRWYSLVIGDEEAERLTAFEEHHDRIEETEVVQGVVQSISAVWSEYAPIPGEARGRAPVAGTATIVAKDSADGWEQETATNVFIGYLVDLDAAASA